MFSRLDTRMCWLKENIFLTLTMCPNLTRPQAQRVHKVKLKHISSLAKSTIFWPTLVLSLFSFLPLLSASLLHILQTSFFNLFIPIFPSVSYPISPHQQCFPTCTEASCASTHVTSGSRPTRWQPFTSVCKPPQQLS